MLSVNAPGIWLSGVYQARTSGFEDGAGGMPAAGISFGSPHPRFTTASDFEVRAFEAEEGRMLLFPSYFWHGILPFQSAEARVSYASDILSVN